MRECFARGNPEFARPGLAGSAKRYPSISFFAAPAVPRRGRNCRMRTLLLTCLILAASGASAAADTSFDNPLLRQRADPQAFLHTDGQYYFTATSAEWDRIEISRTRDLNALDQAQSQVIWRKHASGPMSAHIWAPEIHFIDGKWYLYFTASRADAIWEVRPYALVNDSADPFKGEWRELGRIETGWDSFSLDGTTFVHDQQRYFVWTQRGRTPEEGRGTNIYIAKMSSPTVLSSKATLLSKPEYEWEKRKYDVNEGPAVIIRNGRVFMTYSASAIDANYCMGLLTASADADLLDPKSWAKSSQPVFKSSAASGLYGPGHNYFTTTPDGKTDLFLYHARDYLDILGSELADPNRHTRAQVLNWNEDGTPDFGEPRPDPGKVAPKPLFRDPVFDGAADPVVVYSGAYGRWYMYYTNRRASLKDSKGVQWVHGTRIGMAESLDAGVTWKYIGEADIKLPPKFGALDSIHGGPTHWAPDVVRDDMGIFHMFLTVVPGVFDDWNHPRTIVHLTSKDARHWGDARPVKLATDRAIDAGVIRLPQGGWRMFYNHEPDQKSIWYADSPDLESWTDRGKLIGDQGGEGPKPFRWRGHWWLITDVWKGLAVYRSDDGEKWTRQGSNLLAAPGKGTDDQAMGQHGDVVVSGDRAWLFYFTHPERKGQTADTYATRRSSLQVVELREQGGVLSADRDVPTRVSLR
jgi:GH43 family beta-xylosidase